MFHILWEKNSPLQYYFCLNFAKGVTDINCKIMRLIRPRKSPIISNSFMELEQRCHTDAPQREIIFLITISSGLSFFQQKVFRVK